MIQNSKPNKKAKGNNPNIVRDGVATRFKKGQVANPEGMPKIKTNANYWAAKYSQFTVEELKAELAKPNLKAIQVSVLRDWAEMMKKPSEANQGWTRLKEQYDRDGGKPMQSVNVNQTVTQITQEVASMDEETVNNRIRDIASAN